jgi:hypothetical protein
VRLARRRRRASRTLVGPRAALPFALGDAALAGFPTELTQTRDGKESSADAERLVDAFEALPREERVRLIERVLFGPSSGEPEVAVSRSAPSVAATASATGGSETEDDEGVVASPSVSSPAFPSDEELDLRDFGPQATYSSDDAWTEDALVEKWREVFGDDPPENVGVDAILGDDAELEGISALFAKVKTSTGSVLYAVERAWANLVYKFGRQGAIAATGLATLSAALVLSAIVDDSADDEKDEERKSTAEKVAAAPEMKSAPSEDVSPPSNGVLWERKEERVPVRNEPPPSSSSSSSNNGVLWTRRDDGESSSRSARRRGAARAASERFDDGERDYEKPQQVLWTRKSDPESREFDDVPEASSSYRDRAPPRRAVDLDDNLEDVRAFSRRRDELDRDSPR